MNQTSPEAQSPRSTTAATSSTSATSATPPVSATPATSSGRLRAALRLLRVRLRFVLVLLVVALVVGQWDWFTTHFHRLTASWLFSARSEGVSPDTEYFCPMCPGVLSGWPDTCAVCNMPLVRRRKGEMTTLPTGVIARMQFTPQRVQLAGVQTETLRYEPLQYPLEALGRVVAESTSSTAQPHVVIEFLSPAEELWQQTAAWELRD
ncbi:MAG: heavy metal-binding domain-containing protein, partial [Planctomycetota bacterium]